MLFDEQNSILLHIGLRSEDTLRKNTASGTDGHLVARNCPQERTLIFHDPFLPKFWQARISRRRQYVGRSKILLTGPDLGAETND